jgi:hypothetical protein
MRVSDKKRVIYKYFVIKLRISIKEMTPMNAEVTESII